MRLRILLLSFAVLVSTTALMAQTDGVLIDYVGTARDNSAVLDVRSADQGMLVPRVALTSTASAAPIYSNSPATGLLVYNTASVSDVTPGFYYWTGSAWMRLVGSNAGLPTGSGTVDYVPKWTPNGSTLGNSQMIDNGTGIGIGMTAAQRLDVAGNIRHSGTMMSRGATYSSTWMQFDEHQHGNSLLLGSGGLTAIGSGESMGQVRANVAASAETLYLASDGGVNVVTNLQGGWASRVDAMIIAGNGTLRLPTYTTNGIVRATAGNGTLTSGGGINLTSEVTGLLPVANGGSGIGTLTGYLRGNGTSPFSATATIPWADISGGPTSLPPSGAAGGDLSGTYPNPQVVDDSHNHTELEAKATYSWNAATNPRDFPQAIATSFVRAADGWPDYGSVVHVGTYSNDGGSLQLYAPYNATYGGNSLRYRLGLYSNAGWTAWKTLWDDTNDGAGSGMDADLLDGQQGSYYAAASNIAGTTNYVSKFTSASTIGNSQIFDNGTNVGIGNSNPQAKLHVDGLSYFFNNTAEDMRVGRNVNEHLSVEVDDISAYLDYEQDSDGNAAHTFYIRNNALGTGNNDIRFQTGAADRLAIHSGGNVGIGTVGPTSKLQVTDRVELSRMGTVGTYDSQEVQQIWSIGRGYNISTANNDFGNTYGITYAHTNAGTSGAKKPIAGWGHQILFTSNGTRNASISVSTGNAYFAGNVGVATTSPTEKLQVEGHVLSQGVKNSNGTVTSTAVTTKRYHVSSRYATANRTTVPIDMDIIHEICGDEDGCEVRLFMRKWSNNSQTEAATRGPYVFTYVEADGRWRLQDNDGVDGASGTQHIVQWWDCYITDGNYLNGTNQGDPGRGIGLLNWNEDYNYSNKTCECTFID